MAPDRLAVTRRRAAIEAGVRAPRMRCGHRPADGRRANAVLAGPHHGVLHRLCRLLRCGWLPGSEPARTAPVTRRLFAVADRRARASRARFDTVWTDG